MFHVMSVTSGHFLNNIFLLVFRAFVSYPVLLLIRPFPGFVIITGTWPDFARKSNIQSDKNLRRVNDLSALFFG
jgi:hypothetical protein